MINASMKRKSSDRYDCNEAAYHEIYIHPKPTARLLCSGMSQRHNMPSEHSRETYLHAAYTPICISDMYPLINDESIYMITIGEIDGQQDEWRATQTVDCSSDLDKTVIYSADCIRLQVRMGSRNFRNRSSLLGCTQ